MRELSSLTVCSQSVSAWIPLWGNCVSAFHWHVGGSPHPYTPGAGVCCSALPRKQPGLWIESTRLTSGRWEQLKTSRFHFAALPKTPKSPVDSGGYEPTTFRSRSLLRATHLGPDNGNKDQTLVLFQFTNLLLLAEVARRGAEIVLKTLELMRRHKTCRLSPKRRNPLGSSHRNKHVENLDFFFMFKL